ncbi:hypothetical protein TVAG_475230 [Trichomonas vaginalis G3]|uniref:Uncharacterized protein n=1 Tax=Trichomonas vaginalis (strain ATCC PRA-98 / G3) TaxID=412133 RepID=A2EM30_TRIV3|nr:hypothetical protein TVAGG3_0613530 [Trichomonas vaginalis G3]EAY06289.1 hypothetical protein TVAG_475230 [Trichomonas vaginalis G3]KAI5503367.1 hypothetical protein TVAGG3_0613530 [Trichomonas vaginalis G3]|eukprot:XP_001318512.1 hypothetical protein [Trichomonas vaginalis G3]
MKNKFQSPFTPPKYKPQGELIIPSPLQRYIEKSSFDFEGFELQPVDEDHIEIRDYVVRKYANTLSEAFSLILNDAISISNTIKELKSERTTLHSSVDAKYPKQILNSSEIDFMVDVCSSLTSSNDVTTLTLSEEFGTTTKSSPFESDFDTENTQSLTIDDSTCDTLYSTTDPALTTTGFLKLPGDTFPLRDKSPQDIINQVLPLSQLRGPAAQVIKNNYDSLKGKFAFPFKLPNNNNNNNNDRLPLMREDSLENTYIGSPSSSNSLFNSLRNTTQNKFPPKPFDYVPKLPQFKPPENDTEILDISGCVIEPMKSLSPPPSSLERVDSLVVQLKSMSPPKNLLLAEQSSELFNSLENLNAEPRKFNINNNNNNINNISNHKNDSIEAFIPEELDSDDLDSLQPKKQKSKKNTRFDFESYSSKRRSNSPPNIIYPLESPIVPSISERVNVQKRCRAGTIIGLPPLPELDVLPKLDLTRPGINLQPSVYPSRNEPDDSFDSLRGS